LNFGSGKNYEVFFLKLGYIFHSFMNLVAKSNIKALGLGSENPIGNNKTQEGRSKNRRVEIRVKIGNNHNLMD